MLFRSSTFSPFSWEPHGHFESAAARPRPPAWWALAPGRTDTLPSKQRNLLKTQCGIDIGTLASWSARRRRALVYAKASWRLRGAGRCGDLATDLLYTAKSDHAARARRCSGAVVVQAMPRQNIVLKISTIEGWNARLLPFFPDMFNIIEFSGSHSTLLNQDHEVGGNRTPPPADEIPFEHRLFTKKEMASYFSITERTIESWMRRRYIPFIKIGQSVRFRVASVLQYVDSKYLMPAGETRRRKHRKSGSSDREPVGHKLGTSNHIPCIVTSGSLGHSVGTAVFVSEAAGTIENHSSPSSLGTTSK